MSVPKECRKRVPVKELARVQKRLAAEELAAANADSQGVPMMTWSQLLKEKAEADDWEVAEATPARFAAANPDGSVIEIEFDGNEVVSIQGKSVSNLQESLVDWEFPKEPSVAAANAFIEQYGDW